MHFYERGNRVRCFVCDLKGGHSCVDLVMGILSLDVGSAVRWIAERFPVPNIKPGAPLGRRTKEPAPYRVGLPGSDFEVAVRSGMFGQLKPAERCILVTLLNFQNPDTGVTLLSYQAIMRYSGVARRGDVSSALKQLQKLHALQKSQGKWVGATRQCSSYRVTLEDPKFFEHCNSVRSIANEQIAKERAYRAQLRAARERQNTTRIGGLLPPDPPRTVSLQMKDKPREEAPTCEGQNLSSSREFDFNNTVPTGNRDIAVLEEVSTSEVFRRRMLQKQPKKLGRSTRGKRRNRGKWLQQSDSAKRRKPEAHRWTNALREFLDLIVISSLGTRFERWLQTNC